MKKELIVIWILIVLVGLLSGCFEYSFTDDERIISFAKTIDVGINETENMTLSYSYLAYIQKNDWYSITVYINYIDEPWKNYRYGTLWFKMDGSNYLNKY